MRVRLLLFLLVPLVLFITAPVDSRADASVVQDSCAVYVEAGITYVRIYFTVVNFSLPTPVCDLHMIPEGQPVPPECQFVECGAPDGWSCSLTAIGGADWYADTPGACIGMNSSKGGFSIVVDPGFCCYTTEFTDGNGGVIVTQEECFTLCGKLPTEDSTWGALKERFR